MADQWDKTDPAGTELASDLDTLIIANNNALDRLVYNYRQGAMVIPASAATVTILPGELALPNSDGSIVRWRRTTSNITVAWADIDTGSEAGSTQYYVYAVADADATTFTATISTSSTAPSGKTYYRKIGYFYNNSSSDIVSVGNIKEGGVGNIIQAIGTSDITASPSGTYTDMTDMVVYFVSSGRPVLVTFNAPIEDSSDTFVNIEIDGTDKVETFCEDTGGTGTPNCMLQYLDTTLSSGAHTVKVQWKNSGGGTVTQNGSTDGDRVLIVQEL